MLHFGSFRHVWNAPPPPPPLRLSIKADLPTERSVTGRNGPVKCEFTFRNPTLASCFGAVRPPAAAFSSGTTLLIKKS